MILLERLMDVNTTIDAGKEFALTADYQEKMNKIKDKAKEIEVSI